MTGFNRKKKELESKQVDLERSLEKLQLQAKTADAGQFVKIFNIEMLGVQRKLTNVKMRLRSMEIKKGETCSERLSNSLPVFHSSQRQKHNLSLQQSTDKDPESKTKDLVAEKTTKAITEVAPEPIPEAEIDEVDDEFDPTEFIYIHQRPITSVLPGVPLPHSELQNQYMWTRPVARCRYPPDDQSLLEGEGNLQSNKKKQIAVEFSFLLPRSSWGLNQDNAIMCLRLKEMFSV